MAECHASQVRALIRLNEELLHRAEKLVAKYNNEKQKRRSRRSPQNGGGEAPTGSNGTHRAEHQRHETTSETRDVTTGDAQLDDLWAAVAASGGSAEALERANRELARMRQLAQDHTLPTTHGHQRN